MYAIAADRVGSAYAFVNCAVAQWQVHRAAVQAMANPDAL